MIFLVRVIKIHEFVHLDDDDKIMDDDGRAGRVNLYNDSDSDDYQLQTGRWEVANSQDSRRR
jgi:hypothetical protein